MMSDDVLLYRNFFLNVKINSILISTLITFAKLAMKTKIQYCGKTTFFAT